MQISRLGRRASREPLERHEVAFGLPLNEDVRTVRASYELRL
jgi:hypothetical protein